MLIKTSDLKALEPFVKKNHIPDPRSHKGQNGRVLIIGGSSLFHAAPIWAAQVASHFVDFVHFASTEENNEIIKSIKKDFRNGIVIPQRDILSYVEEDDVILVGPGMVRGEIRTKSKEQRAKFDDILKIKNEGEFTYYLTKYLIEHFPKKRFVFDVGALQMMEASWLKKLESPAIVTPHIVEFKKLFGLDLSTHTSLQKEKAVKKTAREYKCVILLKAVEDYISDGTEVYHVKGGNAGLTKGGTGDVLAGLTAALAAKNDPVTSAILASVVLKRVAQKLSIRTGFWYNIENIIGEISPTFFELFSESIK